VSQTERARAPIFLPYLSGERTPHNDANASGTFIGLRPEHAARDLAYAVMEGVTFALMDGLQAMQGHQSGGPPLALVGGGARSDPWARMIASGLGRPLLRDEASPAAAALGAARLGWMALGGAEASVCRTSPAAARFEPHAEEAALLKQRHQQFRDLYPLLRPWFASAGSRADLGETD
jgi:xylulokinase